MRPNVVAWVLGALVAVAGVAVAVVGVLGVLDVSGRPGTFTRSYTTALDTGVSQVIWGVMIFTIGCYIWRGARRRGWKDRTGRVVISAGYLILGYGMSRAVHAATEMWFASPEDQQSVAVEVASVFLGFGVVGAFLVWLGVRMANEIIITTVEGRANFG